jgi:hypothetical protein
VADEQTCGKGLAQNSVVPAALAEVAGRLAGNLELHMRALERDDPAAAREHAVYERVARGLRGAAADLRAAGEEMAGARDLPMGRHDMQAMTSPRHPRGVRALRRGRGRAARAAGRAPRVARGDARDDARGDRRPLSPRQAAAAASRGCSARIS